MKLKILFLILTCALLVLCLAACGGEDTCTVEFNTNGGGTIEPVTVTKGEKISTPKKPEKSGYTFDGWYLDDEKWSFAGYVVTEDITLEAKWSANENTLTFDANGGEGSMASITVKTAEAIDLPQNEFTRNGYKFVGWAATKTGEVEYKDGAEYKMGKKDEYTLFAVWELHICPSGTHVFSEWVTKEEATCSSHGTKERICIVCEQYTELQRFSNSDNHKFENKICSLCGAKYIDPTGEEIINSIGGVSETFVGFISDESYLSEEEAVDGFLSNQLSNHKNASLLHTELNNEEIEALNIQNKLQNSITSVKKYTVSVSSSTECDFYIVECGREYFYYTVLPKNGEPITNSYYESVFNNEKYENCTFTKVSYIEVKAGLQKLTATITQTIKHADEKVLFEQVIEGDPQLMSQLGSTQNYLAAYIEIGENGNENMYIKQSRYGSWTESRLYGYSADTLAPFYDQHLDYTYFEKTDFGFALRNDNALRFYTDTISGQGSNQYLEDAELNLYAEYYVADGVLSGMHMEYSATITVNGSTQTTGGENKMICTDYGTTIVERPF